MPHLDHTGPDGSGSKTGRSLGLCKHSGKTRWSLGEGMGRRRKSSGESEGKARRLKSGEIFDK